MTARGWRWLVALAVVATALIGIAGALNIDFVDRIIRPHQETIIECQDSPGCRAFIDREIIDAIRSAIITGSKGKGVVAGGGNENPHGQPGAGKAPDQQQGGGGSETGGGNAGGGDTGNILDLPPICAQVGTIKGCTPPVTVGPLGR